MDRFWFAGKLWSSVWKSVAMALCSGIPAGSQGLNLFYYK